MSNLSPEEKELILNFYFGCGEEQDLNRARNLVADNPQAAKLYASLQDTLSQLDSIEYEPCPDNLAQVTIARLKLAASAGKTGLQNLLEKEQKKTFPDKTITRQKPLTNIFEVAAVAAMFLIITGLGFPLFSNIRQKSRQTECQAKMRDIGNGLASYANDNKDLLPSVATTAGAPWWKIGHQGAENHSNTIHLWLLVKENYVDTEDFICPGHKDATPAIFNTELTTPNNDFPLRNNISYSSRINCRQVSQHEAIVIMADRNPIFADIPQGPENYELDNFTKILVSEKLKKIMSPNHNQKGQNVLHCDGSVIFISDRIVSNDDIYTIQGVDEYSGCEVPHDDNDIFLAP